MQINKASISVLVSQESTTIELRDGDAGVTFAKVKLTPEQLSMALSRLMNTPCTIDVSNLDVIGKKLEVSNLEFEIPDQNFSLYSNRKLGEDNLHKTALSLCKDGWIPDKYYGSQDSLFTRDDKKYAKVTIRRWV